MGQPKILALAGSTSRTSYNRQLLGYAVTCAHKSGLVVDVVDLQDYPMPFYNADLEGESGLPASTKALQNLVSTYDGFLLACPEYNAGVTALLKNTIDWISRPVVQGNLSVFAGKTAALISASPAAHGGLRGLVAMRAILNSLGVTVVAEQVCVRHAHETLGDPESFQRHYGEALQNICERLGYYLKSAAC